MENLILTMIMSTIILLIIGIVIYVIQAIFLNKFNKLVYGKGSLLAWIPFANYYLLGKLTVNKIVGWILVLINALTIKVTTTLNGVETTSSIFPENIHSIVSKIIQIITIGFYIYAIIKYFKLKKDNKKNKEQVTSTTSNQIDNLNTDVINTNKNIKEKKEIPEYLKKIYIVSIIIGSILILLALLIYFGLKEQENNPKENTTTTIRIDNTITTESISDNTTTTSTTLIQEPNTTTTTTTNKILSEDEITENVVKNYIEKFYINNYINNYEINSIEIIDILDCHGITVKENQIYASVTLTYDKINENVEVNTNETQIDGKKYKLEAIYIIDKANNKSK